MWLFAKVKDYSFNTKYQPQFYILAVLSRIVVSKMPTALSLEHVNILFYIEKKKKTADVIKVTDFEMGRLSWIIQVDPL